MGKPLLKNDYPHHSHMMRFQSNGLQPGADPGKLSGDDALRDLPPGRTSKVRCPGGHGFMMCCLFESFNCDVRCSSRRDRMD